MVVVAVVVQIVVPVVVLIVVLVVIAVENAVVSPLNFCIKNNLLSATPTHFRQSIQQGGKMNKNGVWVVEL